MPTPTFDLIGSTVLNSSTATVTFSGINSSFRDLVLVANCSTDITSDNPGIRFNGDSGSNYNALVMLSGGSSALSYSRTNITSGWMEWYSASGQQLIVCEINDYATTNKHKTALFRRDQPSNVVSAGAIRWANTAAITSLTVLPGATTGSGNFNTGSSFYLYGVVS
jgi:hypothetical protein